MNTDDKIRRQVAFKGAIELCAKNIVPLKDIDTLTNEFDKLLKVNP